MLVDFITVIYLKELDKNKQPISIDINNCHKNIYIMEIVFLKVYSLINLSAYLCKKQLMLTPIGYV